MPKLHVYVHVHVRFGTKLEACVVRGNSCSLSKRRSKDSTDVTMWSMRGESLRPREKSDELSGEVATLRTLTFTPSLRIKDVRIKKKKKLPLTCLTL